MQNPLVAPKRSADQVQLLSFHSRLQPYEIQFWFVFTLYQVVGGAKDMASDLKKCTVYLLFPLYL